MAIGDPARADVVPGADATVVRADARGGRDPARQDQLPALRRRDRDRQPGLRAHEQPLRPARTPGGSSGGEAAIVGGGRLRARPRHRLGRERAPAGALLRAGRDQADVGPRARDRGDRRRGADRRARRRRGRRSACSRAAWPTSRSRCGSIAGPDGRDGGIAPVPLGDSAAGGPRAGCGSRRSASSTTRAPTRRPAQRSSSHATAALREAGATVEETAPPSGGHDDHDRGLALLRRRARRRSGSTGCCAAGTRTAPRCSPGASAYDLLLSPVFGGPAPPHGTLANHEGVDPTGFTTPHSLTGWPAATVRCGSSPEGLPIGMQLVARPWRDDVALAAAAALERALGGWRPPAA